MLLAATWTFAQITHLFNRSFNNNKTTSLTANLRYDLVFDGVQRFGRVDARHFDEVAESRAGWLQSQSNEHTLFAK